MVDHLRPAIPLTTKDILIPYSPEAGDMVLIKGDSDHSWLGHVFQWILEPKHAKSTGTKSQKQQKFMIERIHMLVLGTLSCGIKFSLQQKVIGMARNG